MSALLVTHPRTRINDRFVMSTQQIDFSPIDVNFNDTIIKGVSGVDYRAQADFYNKIGVDIVTETAFEYPYPFITEKTYRPIASMRPFIIVGPYQTLKFLKQVGFKTFSVIIDEAYDDIRDPEQRFVTVCDAIKTFVDRPLDSVRSDLAQVNDILIHNRTHLENLISFELERFRQQI